MSLSVIVAVDNRPQMLTYFFDQLIPSLDPSEDELILISDACRDVHVLKALRKLAVHNNLVHLVALPEKVGFGHATNIGARESNADTLIFLNTDVFPDRGAIHALARQLDEQNVGAAQGLLVYPQTLRVQSTGHVFSDYLNFHALEGREIDHPLVQRAQERQALSAAFCAVRKSKFQELGGFDEFFFNAWEGLELTLRITRAGMRCVYTPRARAFHVRGGGRRHLPLDETQQIGYFWARWGSYVKNDLVPLLAEQLTPVNLQANYFAINCGSTSTWRATLQQLGLKFRDQIQVADRFESRICLYDNLAQTFLVYPTPLLFFADHFEQLFGNRAWFGARATAGDLVVDLRGNVLPAIELA